MEQLSNELFFAIIVQVLSAGIFIGGLFISQKFLIDKLNDFKRDTKEHFDRLEIKQDKHNSVIERMAKVEASSASSHHRIDELQCKVNKRKGEC